MALNRLELEVERDKTARRLEKAQRATTALSKRLDALNLLIEDILPSMERRPPAPRATGIDRSASLPPVEVEEPEPDQGDDLTDAVSVVTRRMMGDFTAPEVLAAVATTHETAKRQDVSWRLMRLVKEGKLVLVRKGAGPNPSVYRRAAM